MALIIKGNMPTKCCLGGCPIHESCNKYDSLADTRPFDCPIIGEIPDEHGRLIDADKFISELRATINKVLLGSLLHNIFVNDESVKQDTLDGINFVLDRLENAPTVLEATE